MNQLRPRVGVVDAELQTLDLTERLAVRRRRDSHLLDRGRERGQVDLQGVLAPGLALVPH